MLSSAPDITAIPPTSCSVQGSKGGPEQGNCDAAGCTNLKIGATIGEGETRGALGCASDIVNDVHVDAVSKALNVNCRSPGKFMNVSCELFLTKRVLLPQHDDRSEHQDHEGTNFSRVAGEIGDLISFSVCITDAAAPMRMEHAAADTGLEGGFLVWE